MKDIIRVLLLTVIQGVYNSWKYWKSPGILLVLLENFYNLMCNFRISGAFYLHGK